MAKVIVFGVGQWAELAHFYFTHDSAHEVAGFTIDRDYLEEARFKDLPVVPFDEVELHFPPGDYDMFVPLSFKKMNHVRADKYAAAKAKDYKLVSYVSSKATIFPGFECGDNCFILEDNTIQPFVRIGSDVVMWSGNHIGHHSVVEDHVMITSHVVVSGCCTIGAFSFLGVNSTVRDETVIGNDTLVGMGVTIAKDTQPFEVYRDEAAEPTRIRSDRLRSLSHKSKG